MPSSLTPFFDAKGVAILGASTNPKKLSYGILENLVSFGYQGEVYPVNPNATEILGKKAYASISDVPDPVELAVVVLPVTVIMETMREIGERGIKAVVIITGGFRELGEEGAKSRAGCEGIGAILWDAGGWTQLRWNNRRFGLAWIQPSLKVFLPLDQSLSSPNPAPFAVG